MNHNSRASVIVKLIVFAGVATITSFTPAQVKTSKTRFVVVDHELARCGPSVKFYPTGALERGATVEVFHETADGWSGIRPPEGSFSWLAASSAYLLPGGSTCEVADVATPAWIGSSIEIPKQYRWQIQLQPTQQLQVVEEVSQEIDSKEKRLWYKILPPQGEFRWVRTDALAVEPPSARSKMASTTKVPAKSEATDASHSLIQLANHQIPLERGESIVWSNEKEVMRQQGIAEGGVYDVHGNPIHDSEMVGETIIDDGEGMADGEPQILVAGQPSQLAPHLHGEGPFRKYSAIQMSDSGMRFRPLERLLGLIGFAFVEVDAPQSPQRMLSFDPPIGSKNGTRRSMSGHLSNDPEVQGRLDSLPRPSRRLDRQIQMLDNQEQLRPANDQWLMHNDWEFSNPIPGSSSILNEQSPKSFETLPSPIPDRNSQLPSGINGLQGRRSLLNTSSQFSPVDSLSRPGQPISMGMESSSADTWNALNRPTARVGMSPAQSQDTAGQALSLSTPELQSALVELSRIVSGPTEKWDLRNVRQYTENWVENGQSSLNRGEARLLLERINQFESLRIRTANAGSASPQFNNYPTRASFNGSADSPTNWGSASQDRLSETNVVPAIGTGVESNWGVDRFLRQKIDSLRGINPNELGSSDNRSQSLIDKNDPPLATAPIQSATNADASGWLVSVLTSRVGQPEFALTDSTGTVITYVQPAPGVNLRRYVKQPVAVYGIKGYLPELAARQIVAERVVRLQ